MMEILQILSEFKKRVSEKFGEVEVVLFGSCARGSTREESDIDVFVILDRDVDIKVKESIYDIAYEFNLKYDIVLDVSVYSKKEWDRYRKILPFIVNVEKEGIIV
ncbi:MAG: hypothetical protein JG779_167 [Thermotoga sp.]|jgi:predicted nucleotidyltransferase|uniref:Polymerase nucleotidyl transferase domain-containing protein n=2 Tax=Thermotogaceae TaxID=188709 RepID=B9K9X0_THENN|nr:nucleotidyltransferase domain-containing protein [Thermotoga sp. RQ7]ACM23753.1 Putative uncharacterized protein [Thermotoga neapolitana DSM 4359]MBZ4661013.1 hypothetical protein [Thermotoga sp.]